MIDKILKRRNPIDTYIVKQKMFFAKKIYLLTFQWDKKTIANKLNIDESLFDMYLSGTYNFTLDEIFRLEKILGIKLIDE